MKILAFDTSTKYLSIALMSGDDIVAEFHEDMGIRHSEVLAGKIKELTETAGWSMQDIDLISVGIGPGSFTGLRIGVSTAKGIAAVTGCNVIGVPSMDAMLSGVGKSKKKISPLLDARKGKVYACIYSIEKGSSEKITEPVLTPLENLLSELKEKVVFFGDGAEKYAEMLETSPLAEIDSSVDWYPKARAIARIGRERSKNGTDDPADLDPLYLYSRECSITNE